MEKFEYYQGDDIDFEITVETTELTHLDSITGFDSFSTIKIYPQTLTEIVELTNDRLTITPTSIKGTITSEESSKMLGNITFGIELIKLPSTTEDVELNIHRILTPSTPITIKTFRKPLA